MNLNQAGIKKPMGIRRSPRILDGDRDSAEFQNSKYLVRFNWKSHEHHHSAIGRHSERGSGSGPC